MLTDLEMTRLCAEAMQMDFTVTAKHIMFRLPGSMELYSAYYWPLQSAADAMALVEKFDLHIGKTLRTPKNPRGSWFVSRTDKFEVVHDDLKHAIVECCAKLQAAKGANQ